MAPSNPQSLTNEPGDEGEAAQNLGHSFRAGPGSQSPSGARTVNALKPYHHDPMRRGRSERHG